MGEKKNTTITCYYNSEGLARVSSANAGDRINGEKGKQAERRKRVEPC